MKPTMTEEERILTLEEKVTRLQFDVYALQNNIDAVSVVRCKECRFGTWGEDVEGYDCMVIDGCWFEANHYCSYGERKESDDGSKDL